MYIDRESKFDNKLVSFEKIPYGGVFQSSGRAWLKSGVPTFSDEEYKVRTGMNKPEAVDVMTGERVHFEPTCPVTPYTEASIRLGEPGVPTQCK